MKLQPFWLAAGAVPPPWFCFPLARRNQITLIQSPPGVGKSQLLLTLAIQAARGFDLFDPPNADRNARRSRRVLFLGLDAPWTDYSYLGLCLAAGLGLERPVFRNHQTMRAEALDLMPIIQVFDSIAHRPLGLEKLVTFAVSNDFDPDVIIIDTLRHCHNYSENDDQQMFELMDRLRRLAGRRAIVIAHHTAKAANDGRPVVYGGRGSSIIAGSADIVIDLSQKRKLSPCSKLLTLYFAKGRGPDLPESLLYRMDWSADSPWAQLSLSDDVAPDPAAILRDRLESGRGYTWTELTLLGTGLDLATLAKARDDLPMVKVNGLWFLPEEISESPDPLAES